MKLKILGFSILIAFMLTACYGASDDERTTAATLPAASETPESVIQTSASIETESSTAEAVETTETIEERAEVVRIEAEVEPDRELFVGDTLTAADFNVTVFYSDGGRVDNPDGWWAEPLILSAEQNKIDVYYADEVTLQIFECSVLVTAGQIEATEADTKSATEEESTAETEAEKNYYEKLPEGIVETDTAIYTYDMMVSDLYALAEAYPDRMQLFVAGYSLDGRGIYKAVIGNPNAPRQIFICAATHAREYMTTQLVMLQMSYYLDNYDAVVGNRTIRQIFDETCFVVVPMVNPDGVTISQFGESGIYSQELIAGIRNIYANDLAEGYTELSYEKYLKKWKANARGVDLNRNYSPGWEMVDDRAMPSSSFYKGTAPETEPEVIALMSIVASLSNPIMAVSYHSYGDLVYWQYGQEEPLYSENEVLARAISSLSGHKLAGYSNEAGFSNWCILKKGIISVTVETGTVPCPLPIDELPYLWGKHKNTWLMLATSF